MCVEDPFLQTRSQLCFDRLLEHPNIIKLLGYGHTNAELVILMNLVEGDNLHKLLVGKLLIRVCKSIVVM